MKLYSVPLKKLRKVVPNSLTIGIYGLGKMGLPLAVVFAYKGFNVIGTDVNEIFLKKISKGENPIQGENGLTEMLEKVVKRKKLHVTSDPVEVAKNSDVKIIIVPTYLDNKNNPDLSIITDVVQKIAKGLQVGDIVITESTMPPGTTIEHIGKPLEKLTGLKLNRDFAIGHCPERTSSGTAIEDIMGKPSPKIVGGSDKKTTKILKHIYSFINSRGVISVKDTKTAELVKVWEGIYRDVNIAFANNLYLLCRNLGVDALDVIKACNTDKYCDILMPGPGVGGHCIPVYPYFILKNTNPKNKLLSIARSINDSMSSHVITLAEEILEERNVHIKDASILILGIAYRSGVKEVRKSPGLKIAKELKNACKRVHAYDPQFNRQELEKLGISFKKDFKDIDCIIITTDEVEFKELAWKNVSAQLKTKAIVDTKDIINETALVKLGFSVRRIGYAI